jgi:hypothetical protein
VMRGVLGLCLRDVNNHGGDCGPPADDCGGSDGSTGCFIVSAATGSPASAEVVRLRRLRGRVAASSRVAAELIDAIYAEYHQWSPEIAAGVRRDALARDAVLRLVVRPLLAWYALAGVLALDPGDHGAIADAAEDLSRARDGHPPAPAIASVLEAIRSGEPLSADAPESLRGFASKAAEAARFRLAAWAIIDPLFRIWGSAGRELDAVGDVAAWLATAPLEVLTPARDPDLLDADIEALARFFRFRPDARPELGLRLARAWPDARDALARHGFIDLASPDGQLPRPGSQT